MVDKHLSVKLWTAAKWNFKTEASLMSKKRQNKDETRVDWTAFHLSESSKYKNKNVLQINSVSIKWLEQVQQHDVAAVKWGRSRGFKLGSQITSLSWQRTAWQDDVSRVVSDHECDTRYFS